MKFGNAESRRQALEALDDEPGRHPEGLVWMLVIVWAAIGYAMTFLP